jgi:hypothetical protein
MQSQVISAAERKRIIRYLDIEGESDSSIKQLATRYRRCRGPLKADMVLLERLLQRYEAQQRKGRVKRSAGLRVVGTTARRKL